MLAVRTLGSTPARIMLRHLRPNIAAPVIAQASLAFGVAVTIEASLSFLGVGAKPPTPSWGVDLQVGYQYLANTEAGRSVYEHMGYLALFRFVLWSRDRPDRCG